MAIEKKYPSHPDLTGGGETALHSHTSGTVPEIVYSSYAGDDGAARQITTGFKCSLVFIYSNTTILRNAILFPSVMRDVDSATKYSGGTALHATDGFVVNRTPDNMNVGGETYHYWAISNPSGGANVKSGTVSGASGSVTFNTPFASTPQVVMTSLGSVATRDAILRVDSVSATGFDWTADISQGAAWIATDAGDP